MSHNKLLAALIAAAGAAVAMPATHAADGTIYITGQVTSTTCTITGTSGQDVYVYLDNVAPSAFGGANTTAGAKPFSIKLSGCSVPTGNVHTYFLMGPNVDASTNLLKNTVTAGGTNASVQLVNDSDNSAILVGKPDSQQNSQIVALTSGAAELKYKARYYATTATVNSGLLETSVPYMIIYP